eukprot:2453233-Karenia_brevis.AAC.1
MECISSIIVTGIIIEFVIIIIITIIIIIISGGRWYIVFYNANGDDLVELTMAPSTLTRTVLSSSSS